jgi:hypothetical protein
MERIEMRDLDDRGQMRVIEVILASFIVISALSFVTVFAVTPTTPGFEISDIEKMGLSVLHDMDQQGLLAQMVYSRNWRDLRTILKITLPIDVYFNLEIYNLEGAKINTNDPILYGDASTFDLSKNIASVTYTLMGYTMQNGVGNVQARYQPQILILQLSRG